MSSRRSSWKRCAVCGRDTKKSKTVFDKGESSPYTQQMEVRITPTPEQEAFIRDGIANGRFQSAEDAARAALDQWETYERRRMELLVDIQAGEASLARG